MLLPPFEEVPGHIRGKDVTRTHTIVALFFRYSKAEACYTERSEINFDPRWADCTRQVLTTIGHDHPLVTISKTGKYAVPPGLYEAETLSTVPA